MVEQVSTNRFLVEFGSYNSDTASTDTERFSTGRGFKTQLSETPSRATYYPKVVSAGGIERFMFGKTRTTGAITTGAGKVILNNADGGLDYLIDRGLDGQDITIREETGDNYPADFPIRFSGAIDTVSFSSLTINLSIKNRLAQIVSEVYQPTKYAGTNNGSSIYLEGTDDDIGGLPKPKLKGSALNFPAILIDRPNEIYQISSDEVNVINDAYVGRAVILEGTQHATLAAFVSAATSGSVTPGEFDFYLGDNSEALGAQERGCYIAFGTTPSKQVTVDADGGVMNICLHSDALDNVVWNTTDITITPDDTTSPDGVTLADKVEATSTSSELHEGSIVVEAEKDYVFHFMAKSVSGNVTGQLAVYDETGAALINTAQSYALTDSEWTHVSYAFTTPAACVSLRVYPVYQPAAAYDAYLWRCEVVKGFWAYPGTLTTTVAVLKDSYAQLTFEIMQEQGFDLDITSALETDQKNTYKLQHYQTATEVSVGPVISALAQSVKGFWTDTVEQTFVVGILELPTAAESVLTVNTKTLMGVPKVKYPASGDRGKGLPIYRATIGYAQNYTEMTEADIFGAAELDDIPFLSLEFRSITDDNAATKTKHLNALERVLDLKIVEKADATSRNATELALYDTFRPIVEIRLPRSLSDDIDLDDVILLNGYYYRIVGRTVRFASSSNNQVPTKIITFQGWGRVAV